jgi:hypothetical protein
MIGGHDFFLVSRVVGGGHAAGQARPPHPATAPVQEE